MRQRMFVVSMLFAMTMAGFAHGAAQTAGKLALPGVFSSHMVLQRDMAAPVWGTAAPGAQVTVTFAGQTKTTQANEKGAWQVKLDPMTASDQPQGMTIAASLDASKPSSIVIEDVLVGEVWVGSGQSNMATPVGNYTNDAVLIVNTDAEYPLVRLLPSCEAKWELATPATLHHFSALMFSFGLPLQKMLHVPVGLMTGAVGGTPSGPWLSKAAYSNDVTCQATLAKALAAWEKEGASKAEQNYTNALAAWAQQVNEAKAAGKPLPTNKPPQPAAPGVGIGSLYERWIHPLQPYAIRGVLWDQGESGTGTGVDQYTLMGALIRGWRQEWGQGDFPFIYVQKPSGGGCAWDPADPVTSKAEAFEPLPPAPSAANVSAHELSIRIMQYTNTAMVISSDLGSGTHPLCKSGYGARAARVALSMVYDQPGEYYGPIYQSHTVEGDKVRVRFTHVGQGLAARSADKLQGFAVAGADRRFHWADAVIEGDTVVVSSDKVPAPVAVRYAFGLTHPWANLFNKDGLPALLFRTDTW